MSGTRGLRENGRRYFVTIAAESLAAEADLVEVIVPSNQQVAIESIHLSQQAIVGDASAKMFTVSILRGEGNTDGDGGDAFVPLPAVNYKQKALNSAVNLINTTVAVEGEGSLELLATYTFPHNQPLVLNYSTLGEPAVSGGSLILRVSAPDGATVFNGTVILNEFGAGR